MLSIVSSPSPLDPEVLESLRMLTVPGEPDVLIDIAQVFLAEVPAGLNGLEQALGRGDADTVRKLAHSLKGSALDLGAGSMAAACSSIEHAAGDGFLETVTAQWPILVRTFDDVRAALEAEIAR